MGQLLASLTLLQPKLLRHEALVIILPLTALPSSRPPLSLLSCCFSRSPPGRLRACADPRPGDSSRRRTSVKSASSPRKPGPCGASVGRTARTCVTPGTSERRRNAEETARCAAKAVSCHEMVTGKQRRVLELNIGLKLHQKSCAAVMFDCVPTEKQSFICCAP